jgi:hypothetical protein
VFPAPGCARRAPRANLDFIGICPAPSGELPRAGARVSRGRVLLAVLAAVLATTGLVVLVFSPGFTAMAGRIGLPAGPTGAWIRLALAALGGALFGAVAALLLLRGPARDSARLRALLQELGGLADESSRDALESTAPAELAARGVEAVRRGREAEAARVRLETALRELSRALAVAPDEDVPSLRLPRESGPVETALVGSVNGLIESSRKHRDRMAALLAEVEDDLVPVHEALVDLERHLAGDGGSAAAGVERRRLVSRIRRALAQVERELEAVRHRLGGTPVERLTEADFVPAGDDGLPAHTEEGSSRT